MNQFNGKIAQQAWMATEETGRLMAVLHRDGGQARFVGGCVRDAIVNRKVVDIDIATPLTPEEVIERLKASDIPYAPTGLKHGTVTAIVDGKPFEITTLRVDVKTTGRHAEVAFTDDWQEDAARRDFTINAMSATMAGEVFDPFGGIADLREGRIVFVGDAEKRIEEDVLRILRFFRFFAHFGKGAPDSAALAACVKLSPLIPKLSAERIRQETFKLLESDRCADVWRMMLENGIVEKFLPLATDVAALEKMVALENKYHGGAFVLRRLAVLLAENAQGVDKTLRLSNEQSAQLARMLTGAAITDDKGVRQLVYKVGSDMAHSLLLLSAAKKGERADFAVLYQTATSFRPPVFPLQGSDILALGWAQGPDIGRIMGAMEEWWLSEDFRPGRTECLEKLRALHTKR